MNQLYKAIKYPDVFIKSGSGERTGRKRLLKPKETREEKSEKAELNCQILSYIDELAKNSSSTIKQGGRSARGAEKLAEDMKNGVNLKESVTLTRSVREFMHTDKLVMLVFKQPFMSVNALDIGTSWLMPESMRSENKIGLIIQGAEVSKLMRKIIDAPGVEDLKNGVRMILHHEIGHSKAQSYMELKKSIRITQKVVIAGAFPGLQIYSQPESESMAQLYALSRVDGGSKERGVNAIAAAIAIQQYLLPLNNIEQNVRKGFFAHWEDDMSMQKLGLTRFDYLGDEQVKKDVMQGAVKYFRILESEFGRANYNNAQRALWRKRLLYGSARDAKKQKPDPA